MPGPTTTVRLEAERMELLHRLLVAQFLFGLLAFAGTARFLIQQGQYRLLLSVGAVVALFGALSLARSRYLLIARLQSALLAAFSLFLAVVNGPVGATFLVLCGALLLPPILLNRREALAFWTASVLAMVAVAVAHTTHLLPATPTYVPVPSQARWWVGPLLTVGAVVAPVAALSLRLITLLQAAFDASERLVQRLTAEAEAREATLLQLQRTREQLTQAQKVELLGQLSGGLAHDMNNALTAVLGEASLLDDREAEIRERIVAAATHAAQLTRQLLHLGRQQPEQRRLLDLGAELSQAVLYVRRLVPSEIEIHTELAPEPVAVLCDPTQILQCVLNLALNARDAMVGGGKLTLSVARAGERFAQLSVADTGSGIPPENLGRIFDPFFTTKPGGLGTGLGLANVKGIVERLGGEVAVQSTQGRGTTFLLRFPLQAGRPEPKPAPSGSPALQGSGLVLVADDDAGVRRVAVQALQRAGFEVEEAASGAAAIVALGRHPSVRLVITDVVMPGGGGGRLVEWLAQHRPGTKVLVISAYAEDDRVKRGVASGVLPFLAKPFTGLELLEAVARALVHP